MLRRSPRSRRPLGALGALVILGALALAAARPGPARGDAMQDAMRLQLLSPAISGDGKSVAMVSSDPGEGPGATGSLAIFESTGALKKRLPLWAPAKEPERATRSYAEATRLLDEGGYRRMARVKRESEKTVLRQQPADPPPTFEGLFISGDYGVTVKVANGTLTVTARRGKRTLGPFAVKLATPAAACPLVAGYSVAPARAGLEPASKLLALAVLVENAEGVGCFSHEAVFSLK
jgi:hypothetical protein